MIKDFLGMVSGCATLAFIGAYVHSALTPHIGNILATVAAAVFLAALFYIIGKLRLL